MRPLLACPLQAPSQAAACSAQFASRAAAVEGAAALLSSACREVQQSELLRTLLRVALLAGEPRQPAGVAPAAPLPALAQVAEGGRCIAVDVCCRPCAAGNFLNAGNRDGAAAGFQIDALLKLKDVRSTRARWA
jgi:hypothetical protein